MTAAAAPQVGGTRRLDFACVRGPAATPESHGARVYLDGREVSDRCFRANAVAGSVDLYVKPYVIDFDRQEPASYRLYGDVVIEVSDG
jgi:hypothetical protein